MCIGSGAISTLRTYAGSSRTSSARAVLANATRPSILHPARLLLPLSVLTSVWADLGLDFIKALPKVGGKSVILTMVDRFIKYCHFIPLSLPYSAESVAQVFFGDIVRLHGIPHSVVSDRDPVFTSVFWRDLMRLMGTKLHMTTAFTRNLMVKWRQETRPL